MNILKLLLPVGFVQVRNFSVIAATMSGNDNYKEAKSIYDFTAKSIKGEEVPLSNYKGHVCLIVNVASKCGLTATNYKQLNELYDEYADSKGLRILAFPCNQFNGQEPGGTEEICSFADRQKVKFDIFEKIDVNGDKAHPLWKYLKKEQGGILGDFIKWNFTKFIVNKEGKVVERHGPNVDPNSLKNNFEKYF
ncbi:probable phospholipid hydroperoxide glutathione peroxidase isoform X1 [Bombus vosnesenskii]|uniref:Glutathione peroxidase n=8 Tax=Bombus TaxID=28641 RepID=A0A6J3L1F5_9HYME|nr:probable phospholipid hydroperoxide glutathione peroxidase isoform X1 [Bombus impatiens]XP_033186525.1 probable phospholipid hydroperoxide glutathione peroxidase isoform X1 [Bombus vancouverensis nearcticus]XP_033311425.1 probable phospholipid hydroperoxide glutathione peroxidase isoform X1 [Bombus bifarius]XP_033359110.1 probable phospholipid hydroperoxide glutathione peroxidase isoform X1 [Bombus vosnesenskii]XP_048263339.1 probable phospholipid hydroperoxide glutathione peroxidase isoform